jgi:threonyl-tRNA synthetase
LPTLKESAVSSPRHRITLAGSEHAVEPGTTVGGALDGGPNVIAARVNGELRDLAWPLADGDVVEPVDIASDDGHYIVRHSAAHVMAQAVQEAFPQAKLGIGPPVENGFYYDFDVPSRSPRRTSRPSRAGCVRSSSRASGSPGGS